MRILCVAKGTRTRWIHARNGKKRPCTELADTNNLFNAQRSIHPRVPLPSPLFRLGVLGR